MYSVSGPGVMFSSSAETTNNEDRWCRTPKLVAVNQTRHDTHYDEFHQSCQEPIEREHKRDWQNHVPGKAVHHGQHGSHIQTVTKALPQARLAFLVALHVDQREEWRKHQVSHPEYP